MGETFLTGLVTAAIMLPAIYSGWWRARRVERGEREQRIALARDFASKCPRFPGEVA